MAFKSLGKQACESDEGFLVQFISRFDIQYIEGARKLTIYWQAEKVGNDFVVLVSNSSFLNWDDGTVVNEPEQKRRNFKAALQFLECDAVFD